MSKKAPTTKDLHAETVLNFIGQFTNLTAEERDFVVKNIELETFEKKSFLVKEGQILNRSYLIMKGCVRQFYLKNGEERTTKFYLEGDSIDQVVSGSQNTPSRFYLQCLEDCVFSVGESKAEKGVIEKFPKFETICRMASETKLAEATEEMSTFIISSPEERYLNLLENRPELIQRVPQFQLASYLGMKPESLSRIRKRVAEKALKK